MIDVAICPLGDFFESIPKIAEWFYNEWCEIYDVDMQDSVRKRIETWTSNDRIPTALVAVVANQVVGTVALKSSELNFPYSPCLAGLYVVPQFRRKGIGAILVGAAEQKAATLEVSRLYLYTPRSQAFYEGLGWSILEQAQLASGAVSVMSKCLERHAPDGQASY
jgi:N-acetylglutamate synthase-like GNAT family acetyltransferase